MKHDGKEGFYKTLLWIAGIIVAFGALNPFIIAMVFGNKPAYETYKDFGQIGDWIGGSSTPIITLASFIIILAAFLAQKEELQLTRIEMKETRLLVEQQSHTMARQRFENTFFQMISLHNQIVSEFMLVDGPNTYIGRLAFKRLHQILNFNHGQTKDLMERTGESFTDLSLIKKAYDAFFTEYEYLCGHYLRNLYRIYKLIDENNEISEEEKEHFSGIIRAQFSSYEQILIFYNGLSSLGSEKFLPLMYKYDAMEHLNKKLLIDGQVHYDLYEKLRDNYK